MKHSCDMCKQEYGPDVQQLDKNLLGAGEALTQAEMRTLQATVHSKSQGLSHLRT